MTQRITYTIKNGNVSEMRKRFRKKIIKPISHSSNKNLWYLTTAKV